MKDWQLQPLTSMTAQNATCHIKQVTGNNKTQKQHSQFSTSPRIAAAPRSVAVTANSEGSFRQRCDLKFPAC
jgi:hypothetical protein